MATSDKKKTNTFSSDLTNQGEGAGLLLNDYKIQKKEI